MKNIARAFGTLEPILLRLATYDMHYGMMHEGFFLRFFSDG